MMHAKQSYLNRDYSVLEQTGRVPLYQIFKLIILLFGSDSDSDSVIGTASLGVSRQWGGSGCCLDVLVKMFFQSFLKSWCSRCLDDSGGQGIPVNNSSWEI